MEEAYKHIKAITETSCSFENGYWNVSQKVIHKRSLDGVNWDDRQVSMTAYDTILENALAKVLITVEKYLSIRDHDLFVEIEEDIENRKLVN